MFTSYMLKSVVINGLCTTYLEISLYSTYFVVFRSFTLVFLIRSCKSLCATLSPCLVLFTVSASLLTSLFYFPITFRKCLLSVQCGAKWRAQWKTMLRLISLHQLRPPYMPLCPQGKLYPTPTQDSKLVFKRCDQQALEIIAGWVCRAQSPRESEGYSYPLLTMSSLQYHWWISGSQIANLRHST